MHIPSRLVRAIALNTVVVAAALSGARAQDAPAAAAGGGHRGANAAQPGAAGEDRGTLFCVNVYPSKIQAKIEAVQRQRARAGGSDHGLQLVIQFDKVWQKAWNNQPVTVSFFGGDTNLHKQVAEAMDDWTEYANVKLDLGRNGAGEYRKWSPNDTTYTSDIRISFNDPEGGYWSLVGTDSTNPLIVGPGEASLNLEGFSGTLTADQRGTALHEMGHALGFQHEHQSPLGGCDQEFRWEDSSDGTPGIYTVLGGSPNFWPRSKVDHNLRQLPNSRKLIVTPYDPRSIMHYSFPSWMFVSGDQSPCHTGRNNTLSDGDKAGIKQAYPTGSNEVAKRRETRIQALEAIGKAQGLKEDFKRQIQSELEATRPAR